MAQMQLKGSAKSGSKKAAANNKNAGTNNKPSTSTIVRDEAKGGENVLMWVEGLTKTYDGLKFQFQDISFVLSRGERAGLIGVNGVGKSSLLKVLAGKDTPNAGAVRTRKGVVTAYVTQDPEFPAGMTIADALYAGETPIMAALREFELASAQYQHAVERDGFDAPASQKALRAFERASERCPACARPPAQPLHSADETRSHGLADACLARHGRANPPRSSSY